MSNQNVEEIDIDNREFNYSNDGILSFLKDYIEYKEKIYDDDGNEIDLYSRLLMVCGMIGYLSDEIILNNTLDILKMFDLVDVFEEDFEKELSSKYSDIDVIKIKAIRYSLTSLYKLNIKVLKFPNSKNPIHFNIKLKGRVIEHNLKEVLKSITDNNVFQFEKLISILPINEQKEQISKLARSFLEVDASKDTKMFKKQIEYLKDISYHLIEPKAHQQNAIGITKEKVPVIALLHYYNGQYITRDNAQSIAKEYNYTSKTSGEGLYQDFLYYVEKNHRTVSEETKLKHCNKIKLFERVVELLTNEKAKAEAITELNLLKTKLVKFS